MFFMRLLLNWVVAAPRYGVGEVEFKCVWLLANDSEEGCEGGLYIYLYGYCVLGVNVSMCSAELGRARSTI